MVGVTWYMKFLKNSEAKPRPNMVSILGVQLFGSFQKIMKKPRSSFVFANNWLLDGLWIGPFQKMDAVNLVIGWG